MNPVVFVIYLFVSAGSSTAIFAQAVKQAFIKNHPGTYKNPLPSVLAIPLSCYVKGDKYYTVRNRRRR